MTQYEERGPQHEVSRKRRGEAPHHKVGHKAPHACLESRKPGTRDSTPWQGHAAPERTEPTEQRLEGEEDNCPEHPLRKASTDQEARSTAFAP
jgi:hypothetical protein